MTAPNGIEVYDPPTTALAAPPEPISEIERLIRLALDKGQNPTELYAIMREERAAKAVQAFARAKWEFLGKCQRIIEPRKGGGITKSGAKFEFPYADLCDILDQTLPILQELGFSHGFTLVVLNDGKQYQRCNFRHAGGHCETADVPYMPDTGGHMNAVQQVGSGLTYSMRYALLAALGLPTGQPAPGSQLGPSITEEQTRSLNDLIIAIGESRGRPVDRAKFLAIFKVATLAEIPASRFDQAWKTLEARKVKK